MFVGLGTLVRFEKLTAKMGVIFIRSAIPDCLLAWFLPWIPSKTLGNQGMTGACTAGSRDSVWDRKVLKRSREESREVERVPKSRVEDVIR